MIPIRDGPAAAEGRGPDSERLQALAQALAPSMSEISTP